jgi:MFS family permease
VSSAVPTASSNLGSITRVLVLIVASIGFLFDTYELLMLPPIGRDAISELRFHKPSAGLSLEERVVVQNWLGWIFWITALSGGAFGLLGGWMIDRFGRKRIMLASILAYSVSPLLASFSMELWQFILFRCTTFIGVCVELVAAVTWLAELFESKRTREIVIGWTLATASLGGLLVTAVYQAIVQASRTPGTLPAMPFPSGHLADNVVWRITLLTGLIPGAAILLLMPFVPESRVWKRRKEEGTLKRPSIGELFSPGMRRATLVTTILSACGYAAAFGALQMTPPHIVPGLPGIAEKNEEARKALEVAQANVKGPFPTRELQDEAEKQLNAAKKQQAEAAGATRARTGDIQLKQELGGLAGRILLAALLIFVPSRILIRLFLIPGVLLFPITYFRLVSAEYVIFATAIFFCGLLTVAQFSFLSELLPRVFPLHLRGTGGSFATNVGGRMLGTMAAVLNTGVISKLFTDLSPAMQVASAAGVIGGFVYLIALIASFFLPSPQPEGEKAS